MPTSDPIADLLTRIRNGGMAQQLWVEVSSSRMKLAIVELLHKNGFVAGFLVKQQKPQGIIRIYLKYGKGRRHVINGLKRVSKPSRRFYRGAREIPKIFGGMGLALLSSSKGVMTGTEAREQNVGGEVLAYVW